MSINCDGSVWDIFLINLMQLGLSQIRKLLWKVSLNIFHCGNTLKMFTENNKALTYIPSALFLYLPKITSFLFLLLKFYWIPDNNHNKTQMLTALNYTADSQHNLRNWNDALIKAPVLKRGKKKQTTHFCFILEVAQKSLFWNYLPYPEMIF